MVKIKLLNAYPQIKIQEWGFFTTENKIRVNRFLTCRGTVSLIQFFAKNE